MATFKEAFAAARKEKGAGKTFTWNGKSYTTDRADDKKPAPTASNKPKAKPAGLNPQSGAAQSGVAGKVKPKPVRNPNATSVAGKVKPKPVRNPNATSVAGKVKPKSNSVMSASAKAGNAAGSAAAKALTTVMKMKEILAGGGLSNYLKKK